jgi:Na+/melibiose symporter-like transporter
MATSDLEVSVRPLTDTERRLLRWGDIRRRRGLTKALPEVMAVAGLVIFATLWGLTLYTTRSERSGPSVLFISIFWLVVGTLISLWSYFSLRSHVEKEDNPFQSALRRNQAAAVRIKAGAVIEVGDTGTAYAFQLRNSRIVFIVGQLFQTTTRFPNSNFTLVDIAAEDGRIAVGCIEKKGEKLIPIRRVSVSDPARIPEHLSVIEGDLSQIDTLLRDQA